MRINHNIAALNTHRQLNSASTNQSKSMEKLASGLRINKAGDDAAGLAISEKMRGQIRGLDQASRNAQDGISLIQTAEGALNETHDILQRMRELGVQAANDTATDDDRAQIQKEMDQLTKEVDRIAGTTQFNTKVLLRGQQGVTNFTDLSSNSSVLAGGVDKVNTNMSSASLVFKETSGNLQDGSQISFTAGGTTYKFEFDKDVNAVEAGANRVATGGNMDASMGNLVSAVNSLSGFSDNFEASYDNSSNSFKITAKSTGAYAGSAGNAITINSTTAGVAGTGLQREESINVNGAGTGVVTFTQDQLNMKISDSTTFLINGTTYEIDSNSSANPANTAVTTAAGGTLSAALTALATAEGGSFDATTGIYTASAGNVTSATGNVSGNAWVGTPPATLAGGVTTAGAQATQRITLTTVPEAGTSLSAGDLSFKFYDSTKSSYSETIGDKEFGIDVNGKSITQVRDAMVAAYTGGVAAEKTQVNVASNSTNQLDITAVDFGQAGNSLGVELGGTGNAYADVTLKFQIGANEDQAMTVNISTIDSGSLAIGRRTNGTSNSQGEDAVQGLDVSSFASAKSAVTVLDSAIQKVSSERAKLGSFQNRLEHTINNLNTSSENLTAAESRVRDVDMAKEMMTQTKNSILAQAAQAMLAQANQQPQGVLQLLR